MQFRPLAALALSLALLGPAAPAAWSQSEPTIDQIYQAADSGQLQQADAMIGQVLRNHPNSAKAHYVKAELAARQSNAAVARAELATAERLAPGLPFARPEAVQALREEVNGRPGPAAAARADARQLGGTAAAGSRTGFSWGLAALLLAVVAGLVAWVRRRAQAPRWPHGEPAPAPTAPEGMPAGYGTVPGGLGSTLGRGLATGLAVGAGAVAAQEIGRRLLDHGDSRAVSSGAAADVEPGLLDPSINADMGGQDFGIDDAGSWDDAGGGGDWGS